MSRGKRGRPPGEYRHRERLVFFVGFRVPPRLYREMVEHRDVIPYRSWSDAFRAFAEQTIAQARQSADSCPGRSKSEGSRGSRDVKR